MEPLLKTEKLCIVFNEGKGNEYTALDNVNIEIYPKEYIIFFGPSGSGKSTLLYSLLGLLTPTSGRILIKGHDYKDFSENEKNLRTSRSFGMIFQQYNLLFSLNVLDNIILPQVFLGGSSRERKEKAISLLRRFGIEARAKQMPGNLSGGQQQRVAVCRALMNDPEIILADEPVGNLDSESAHIVMETLKNINTKDQKTVILVTHDPRYLVYADRVYYFKDQGIDHEEKQASKGPIEEHKPPEPGDLDRLARVHEGLSLNELKSWSISNWLNDEMTLEQEKRFTKMLGQVIEGKISPQQLFEGLDLPYSKGGVGLYSQTAATYAKKVVHILNETKIFTEGMRQKQDSVGRLRLVRELRKCVLEEYKGFLNAERAELLNNAIEERFMGKLDHDQFIAALLPKKGVHKGIGLPEVTIQRLAQRLDLIMSRN